MANTAGSKRRSGAVWCISAAAFALTIMAGAYEVTGFQFQPKRIVVALPAPPAPLPDSAAPTSAFSGSKVSADLK